MEHQTKQRPPRIVFAFATLAVAAVFATGAYVASPAEVRAAYMGSLPEGSASTAPEATADQEATPEPAPEPAAEPLPEPSPEPARESKLKSAENSLAKPAEIPTEAPVEARATKYQMEGDGAQAVQATNANGILTQAIGAFEDKGYTVAFVVHDMASGRELTYNSAQELYPASSIKAPFTTAIYQQLVEKGTVKLESVAPVAEPTILESSDEGYRALHRAYGEQAFIDWLKDAGVEPGSYGTYESMVAWNYPHITASQLARMWIHVYDYLSKGTAPATQLADLLERREVSSLRRALAPDVVSWSKMGWFESASAYRSEPATVEGGVVFAKNGAYVLAVMTNAPALLDDLVPLEAALDRAHQDMV